MDPAVAAAVPAVTAVGCVAEAEGPPTSEEVTESVVLLLLLLPLALPLLLVDEVALLVVEEDLWEAVCLPPVLLTLEALPAFLLPASFPDPDPPPDEAEPLPDRWDDDLLSLAMYGGAALLCSPPARKKDIKM